MAITKDHIKATIAALAAERTVVGSLSPSTQQNHALLVIDQLTKGLNAALQDAEPTWNGWVQGLRPLFKDLAITLKALQGTEVGACDYNGDCIETTADVCAVLPNSSFHPNVPCNP
jgi:hypothetical protein